MANKSIPTELLLGTEERTSIPTKELESVSSSMPVRVSDPAKQGVAGLSDVFTGLPTISGFVGAGLETLADMALDDNDLGFGDTFAKALESGIDRDLLDAGVKGRTYVNEFLGIDEPISTEDQAARLIGSLVLPVPAGFLGGVAAKGAKGIAGKAATFLSPAVRLGPKGNLLNRGVKGQASFPTRAGIQLGIGTGIEQGLRAGLTGQPLLFSEEALAGVDTSDTLPTPQFPQSRNYGSRGKESVFTDTLLSDGPNGIPTNLLTGEEALRPNEFNPRAAAMDKAVQDAENSNTMRNVALIGAAIASLYGINKWRQVLAAGKVPPPTSGTTLTPSGGELSDAVSTIKNTSAQTPGSPSKKFFGGVKASAALAKDKAAKKGADYFDRMGHIVRALRSAGVNEGKISQISGQDIFDTPGQLLEFIESGIFANGTKVSTPLRNLKREYDNWDAPTKQEFIDFMSATREDAIRVRATAQDFLKKADFDELRKIGPRFGSRGQPILSEGQIALQQVKGSFNKKVGFSGELDELDTILYKSEWSDIISNVRGTTKRVKPGLWNKKTGEIVDDLELKARLEKGESNKDFIRVRSHLAEMNDAVLEQFAKRGPGSKKWADSVRAQFTRDGKLIYLPGKENVEVSQWWKRLSMNMGLFTSEGKNLHRVGNFYKSSLDEGMGVASPLDPFQSTAVYIGEVMEHTNRSVAQMNILKELTGISINPKNGKVTFPSLLKDADGNLIPKGNPNSIGFIRPPNYVGKASALDPNNQFGRLNIAYHQPNSNIAGKFIQNLRKNVKPDDPGVHQPLPEHLAALDDALIVQWGGDFYIFNGFDKGLKTAMEFDSSLTGGLLKFGNFWKKTFTAFTTGNLSPFAPISGLYNIQVGSLNAALRAKGGFKNSTAEGIRVWKDGMKGSWELFSTKVADDYAELLTNAIQNNSGIAKMAPNWTANMRGVLARKAKQTMLGPIQRQTGKFAASVNASEFTGNISDVLDQSVFHISQRFGGNTLPQFARIWKHLNNSLHEGTAYGITLRKLGGDPTAMTANQIRQARKYASDVVGDNRLKGSNADAFNAVVPFSGAMLQAWSTMGRAMKKAGAIKTMATITTAVGMPTALEVMYNSALDPEATFQDADGKEWTYNSYYWKGFSVDQRNNNMIVYVPGRDPWDAILVPIVPEISMFRGLVIDAMEVAFGLSEHSMQSGNHLFAGGVRTFNIPLPPPVKAAISALGIDVRAGPAVDEVDGSGISFFQTRNLPTGERVTGSMGRTRFVGGEVETRFAAILQDIFGAGGTASIAIYEAFNAGDESTPISRRIGAGFDQIGRSFKQQARYLNPIFGKSLRNSADPEVARSVVRKKDAIESFIKDLKISRSGGKMSGNIPAQGATFNVTQDPVAQALQANAPVYKKMIQPYVNEISKLRNRINTLGTALRLNYSTGGVPAGPVSVKQRDELIDALNLQIDALNHTIDAKLQEEEVRFATDIGKRLGRDLTGFTFDGFSKRANPSSASPTLPKLPQTSQ